MGVVVAGGGWLLIDKTMSFLLYGWKNLLTHGEVITFLGDLSSLCNGLICPFLIVIYVDKIKHTHIPGAVLVAEEASHT